MTDPIGDPGASPAKPATGDQAGDRPPSGRLDRPPSDRYVTRAAAGGPSSSGVLGAPTARTSSAAGVVGKAIVAGVVTAIVLVIVGGVLAEHRGLLAIAGLGGAAIGLLVARGAASPDGTMKPVFTRRQAARIAAGLALATVVGAALGTWAYGRLEGGVMDPVTYLWETMGLLLPAEAVIAMIAAAWGAGAGPIRWRA